MTETARILRTSAAESGSSIDSQRSSPGCPAALLDILLTATTLGIGFLDGGARFLRVNENLAAMDGCPAAEHPGRTIAEVAPILAGSLDAVLQGVLKTGQPALNIPIHAELPAGAERSHWQVSCYRMPGVEQDRPGLVLVVDDVTEVRHYERAARDRDAQLESLLKGIPAIVWSTDAELRFTYVQGFTTPTHETGAEGCGTVFKVFGTEDREFLPIAAHYRALAGEPSTFEMQWFARHLEAHVEPMCDADGNVVGCIGVALDITERKRSEEALRKSEERYRILAENSAVGIWHVDLNGHTIYCNPCMLTMLELDSIADLDGKRYHDFMATDGLELIALEEPRREAGEPSSYELQLMGRRGGRRDVVISGAPILNAEGRLESTIGIVMDVTEKKRADEARRQAEERYRGLFENAAEGIYQADASGRYLSANSSLARIYGFASSEALMEQLTDVGAQLYVDAGRRAEFWELVEKDGVVQQFEAQIRRPDGLLLWTSESARAVRNENGELLYVEGMVEDITQRKHAERQLLHDALHDKLTGLPNRALFMDRLERALARSERYEEYRIGLLLLDLDDFKTVNDTMGHVVGDKLLRGIARRLERLIRPEDTLARLGGDEFALLVDGARDANDATHVARRIQEDIAAPFVIDGREILARISMGIALSHRNYNRAEDLLRDADAAMYRAKAHGRSRYEIFDMGMHAEAMRRLQLEAELRPALDDQQFFLQYQPIVSLRSGSITSSEALIRWRHPKRGLLGPGEFTAVAEETGLIVPIDRWVLGEACRFMADWRGDLGAPCSMSVNLSQRNFAHPDLVDHIDRILNETSLPPECLMLEITEGVIMNNAEMAAGTLGRLQDRGIRLSIDDFGTGYSSLSYLHRFPVNMLKIDRSFIGRTGGKRQPLQIVGAIITIAHNLGIEVVAEGVETAEQLAALRDLDCGYGQGFYFSRPLDAEIARALQGSEPAW